jgi:hypothetical protein
MFYRAPLPQQPIAIGADGLPVLNSRVIDIMFPSDASETAFGCVKTIVGPSVAKVMVGDPTIRAISLCCPISRDNSQIRDVINRNTCW